MLNHRKCQILIRYSMIWGLVLLMVQGCGSVKKEDIISSGLIQDEEGFGTDTVKYGDFMKTKTFDAERIYPHSTVITAGYDKLVLDRICVEAGTKVKKGDLLVSIQPVTDESITKKKAEIKKNMEQFEAGKNNYQHNMEQLEEQIRSVSGVDLEIMQIELKKSQREYEWYVQDGTKVQEEMKASLEKLKSIKGDVNIYAPYDGVIDSISAVPAGTELTTKRELLKMHSEDQVLLSVSDAGKLRYQMPVTIQAGTGDKKETYTGTVVSADNIRTDSLKDGTAYIKMNEAADISELTNLVVIANEIELKNVLVVKEFAVSKEKKKNFVSIVDGDKVMKRHVVLGGTTGEMSWILQGVEEGQRVLIQ